MGTKDQKSDFDQALEYTEEELKLLEEYGLKEDVIVAAAEREDAEPEPPAAPEPAPKPEQEPAPEPKPTEEPPKAAATPPAEPPPAQPPAAEPEALSLTELTRIVRDHQRENAGLRADLIEERRRRAAAEDLYAQRMRQQPEEPANVPLEMDAEGRYVAPVEKIAEEVVRKLQGRGTQQQDGIDRAAREVGDQAEAVFQTMRAEAMRSAPEPEVVGRAADQLREATSWLDRRVMEELPRFQQRFAQMPPGIDRIAMVVSETSIGKEMAEKYPELDPVELADVALSRSPYRMRRTIESYASRLRSRPAARPPAPEPEPEPEEARARPGHEDRPRPMARRGTRSPETRESATTRFANLKPEEVWNMTDEDFAEMERVATVE